MFNFKKSADRNLVRRLNIALILSYLRGSHGRTRAKLAASTGLTRATVSSLVEELIALGLIRENGLQPSEGGRPGTCLELDPAGGCAIGLEIGVGFVSAMLTDFAATILWHERVQFETRDADAAISIAERLIARAEQHGRNLQLRLLGIGLGLPGLVKIDDGVLKIAPNLGWRDIPFETLWEKQFGVPVYPVNEANAAALGEHYFGVADGYHDFIYLSTSNVGLGGGVVIGGQLFQGIDGYAGEFGHMVLDPSGPLCVCGRHGCWEKMAGPQAITNYVAHQVHLGRTSKALDMAGGDVQKLNPQIVAQAAKAGDEVAYEAIVQMCQLFGSGLLNLINTFNPQLVVIGGGMSKTIEPFLPLIEDVINQQSLRMLSDRVEIRISQLGDDACVMGAIAAVLNVVFSDPTRSLLNVYVGSDSAMTESLSLAN